MIISEDDYLAHYGILRKSGRYPWGSGGTQSERNRTFLGMVDDLRKQGLSDVEVARGFGMTTTELRAVKTIAKTEVKQEDIRTAQALKDKGYSNTAIGKQMGINESSVRDLLAPGQKDKQDVLQSVAGMLKRQVDEKGYIDIGAGVEHHVQTDLNVGVSSSKLATAVALLKEQGYEVHKVQVDQLGTSNKTTIKVLAPPGTTYKDIVTNKDKIHQVTEFSEDGGRTFLGIQPPVSVSSSRVAIRYAEQGGTDADGVVYVRPGKDDVSLGGARYAQVRIAVDGSHYIKGMAMYKEDLPKGVDLMFNTNKKSTGNKLDALKPLKKDKDGNIDLDNPFGAVISRQLHDPKDPTKITSVMNIVNEEGNWDKWSKNLPSQFLSKQSPKLAQTQLNMTVERKQEELAAIMSLTNPAVRKKLLEGYADEVDSAAVHLKAAQIPRQRTNVILPLNTMKETEIYAPNFRDGERVVLVRFPHGGTFELPELVVNNKNAQGRELLGQAKDAVGIHSKVAERLSGADFDGDTVLVIPNDRGQVKTSPALEGLKNFDAKGKYHNPNLPKMSPKTKGTQMGLVSNLITDMTIKGANSAELARAVRHSMVVIDAEKHDLDYKQSAIDNGIPQLMHKYQGRSQGGASTLISRAGSQEQVLARKSRSASEGGPIDPTTGKRVFTPTGESWQNAKGQTVFRKQTSTKLTEADDAHKLSSGTPIEKVYADHSNKLKALANEARKALVQVKTTPYNPSARKVYSNEVTSLNAKLTLALRNAPLERQAQVIANAVVSQKRQAYPDMDSADLKKVKGQALAAARLRTGAGKERIEITDTEWAAIQAGAISNEKLTQILNNANLERVKELATPKSSVLMTSAKKQRAAAMLASGYTQAEVADALGVSLTTLKTTLTE